MQFSWDYLLNMLKNDDSKLQTKFGVHITLNIFQNNPILKSRDRTNPPPSHHLPTLEAYSTHGEGGRFEFFFAKMMNLKVPRAILPLGCAFSSTWAKTVWGLLQPPLGELG